MEKSIRAGAIFLSQNLSATNENNFSIRSLYFFIYFFSSRERRESVFRDPKRGIFGGIVPAK